MQYMNFQHKSKISYDYANMYIYLSSTQQPKISSCFYSGLCEFFHSEICFP